MCQGFFWEDLWTQSLQSFSIYLLLLFGLWTWVLVKQNMIRTVVLSMFLLSHCKVFRLMKSLQLWVIWMFVGLLIHKQCHLNQTSLNYWWTVWAVVWLTAVHLQLTSQLVLIKSTHAAWHYETLWGQHFIIVTMLFTDVWGLIIRDSILLDTFSWCATLTNILHKSGMLHVGSKDAGQSLFSFKKKWRK